MLGLELLLSIVMFASVAWLIAHSFWFRVLGTAALLLFWGTGTVGVGTYFAFQALAGGRVIEAAATLLAAAIPGVIWWVGVRAALEWKKRNSLKRPWNAR